MDVGRILKGSVKLKVDDVETIAKVIGVSVVELMHEAGRDWVADLLPLEKALIDLVRGQPHLLEAFIEFARLATRDQPKPVRPASRPAWSRDATARLSLGVEPEP